MKRIITANANKPDDSVRTYRNNKNRNKYIEVKKGNDGHSYARQYLEWDTPEGKVKNYTASKSNRGRYHRATQESINQMLEDYTPVEEYNDIADELESFRTRMFGDYYCACGCGRVLGRPTNGVDDLPIEWTYTVAREDDDEGFEWRSFKEDDWKKLTAKFSIAHIYDMFETNECVK